MRLLQSVLATLPQTKKPQRKFITHLLGLVLMLPGHATFRNLATTVPITNVPRIKSGAGSLRGGMNARLTLSHSTKQRLPR